MSSSTTGPDATDLFGDYALLPGAGDELFGAAGKPRAGLDRTIGAFGRLTPDDLAKADHLAELALLASGVTFSVYSDSRGTEKIFPYCVIPRILTASDFARLSGGLEQRIRALNLFLDDVYDEQRIIDEGVVPRDVIERCGAYHPQLRGIRPPGGTRINIAGVDLIRDQDTFRVLEDNLRVPSGVSYVLENRMISKQLFPRIIDQARVERVDHYPTKLASTLRELSPVDPDDTTAVVLTPGPYNSAWFEHSFLARTMGIDLVQAPDLFVDDDIVYVRTTEGPQRVHVIYTRTDETFLDPDVFRPDSVLGVRGLIGAYAAGNVALANAPGNGVADDKGVYPFVPEMIRFYLSEEPVLEQVPTWMCLRDDDRAFVLDHLDELVVKAVDGAGGYGMLMGPQSTAAEREEFRARIEAEPRRYIAQRRIELSTCPTWIGESRAVAPRRVDLRPYILTGTGDPWVLPGGLTRVALVEGSYVVNSSQGGGSKDTWVLKGATP